MKTLIVDTREKQPWDCIDFEIKVHRLEEGDYTLLKYLEHEEKYGVKTIRIERKSSTCELAHNLGRLFKPFEREMERLQEYDEKYIVCEFSIDDVARFPKGAGIPKKRLEKVKMTGKFMMTRLDYIYNKYGIEIIYADNRANAMEVMKDLLNGYEKKIQG